MLELARESDWEQVRRLSVQIHDLHVAWRPDIYFHCDEPYPHENYLEDIRNRLVYVAKLKQSVAGYVVLSFIHRGGSGMVPVKQLRIESICVDETFRAHGIGKAMMTDVRALARAFGCRELILGVHPENDAAISFYQKCGFTIRTINMQCNV